MDLNDVRVIWRRAGGDLEYNRLNESEYKREYIITRRIHQHLR